MDNTEMASETIADDSTSDAGDAADAENVMSDSSNKRYRYRSAWEDEDGRKLWLTGTPGASKAFCKVCSRSIRAHLSDIRKHGNGAKHVRRVRASMGGPVPVLSTSSPLIAKLASQGLSGVSRSSTGNTVYKYDSSWEEEPEMADWLDRNLSGDSAFCKFCSVELRPKYSDLRRHAATAKHARAAGSAIEQMRAEVVARAAEEDYYPLARKSTPMCSKKELELRISLCLGVSSLMMGVSDWCALLQTLLGPEAVRMTGVECVNLFNVVVLNHFKSVLQRELGRDNNFSVIVDDIHKMSLLGRLAVCIRYVSKRRGKIATMYLGTISALNTEPDELASSLTQLLVNWKLNLDRLVSVCVDGVNFEEGVQIAQTISTMTSPNVCITHSSILTIAIVVDQATKKAQLPSDLVLLLRHSYNWFAESVHRQLHHSELIERLGFVGMGNESSFVHDRAEGEERLKPLSTFPSKWLAIGEFVGKIVDHWEELKHFFHARANKESCSDADMLANIYMKTELRTLLAIISPFLENLTSLQSLSGWDAISRVSEIVADLAKLVLGDQKTVEELIPESIKTTFRDATHPEVQEAFAQYFETFQLSEDKKGNVSNQSMAFLTELFKGLLSVLRQSMLVAKAKEKLGASCIQNNDDAPTPVDRSLFLPSFFPDQSEENLKLVAERFKMMRMLDWKNASSSSSGLWNEVHHFGDATGNFPLRPVSEGVLKMLTVPVLDADVEAAFGIIHAVTSDCRDRLDEDLIDAILHARFGLSASGTGGVADFKFPAAMTKDSQSNNQMKDEKHLGAELNSDVQVELVPPRRKRGRPPKNKEIAIKRAK